MRPGFARPKTLPGPAWWWCAWLKGGFDLPRFMPFSRPLERVTAVNERIPALWFGVVRSSGAGDSGAELVALRVACPTVCAPFACSPARPLRAASWRSRALHAINLDFLNFPR